MRAGFTDKTSWRGRRFKRSGPQSEADAAGDRESEVAAASASTEDEEDPAPNDDAVLEEEVSDEADISDLLDHHEPDPKER